MHFFRLEFGMDSSSTNVVPTVALETRVTSQGQVSVPAAIRRKLGVEPGSTLQWTLRGDEVVVKRRTGSTFDEMHKILFPNGPPKRRSLKEMDEGIAQYMREKYARG
jgi:antitoxin PrlF